MYRIGIGYDVHPFGAGRDLILGGVHIPWRHGLLGHSDADVLVHALCDAILGALGQGDIGRHFPESDPAYKGIDSTVLLEQVVALMKKSGYRIVNTDMIVIMQAPRLSPYYDAIKTRLAPLLELSSGQLNIKATTTEKLGFEGRGQGVAAQAIVLLSVQSQSDPD